MAIRSSSVGGKTVCGMPARVVKRHPVCSGYSTFFPGFSTGRLAGRLALFDSAFRHWAALASQCRLNKDILIQRCGCERLVIMRILLVAGEKTIARATWRGGLVMVDDWDCQRQDVVIRLPAEWLQRRTPSGPRAAL